jgi:hypothetical protein
MAMQTSPSHKIPVSCAKKYHFHTQFHRDAFLCPPSSSAIILRHPPRRIDKCYATWQTFLVLFLTKCLILGFQVSRMWSQGKRFPTFRRNYWTPEDERGTFLRKVGNQVPSDAASHTRKSKSWAALLWERQNSHTSSQYDMMKRVELWFLCHQQNKRATFQNVNISQHISISFLSNFSRLSIKSSYISPVK